MKYHSDDRTRIRSLYPSRIFLRWFWFRNYYEQWASTFHYCGSQDMMSTVPAHCTMKTPYEDTFGHIFTGNTHPNFNSRPIFFFTYQIFLPHLNWLAVENVQASNIRMIIFSLPFEFKIQLLSFSVSISSYPISFCSNSIQMRRLKVMAAVHRFDKQHTPLLSCQFK